jgi:5-oxoprolinase (ATP-hydrolysing) subunit A
VSSDKPLHPRRIDLNADVGEYPVENPIDDRILPLVTSASIACGFHAGGPAVMRRTIETAIANGVAIGAHPSFDDRAGFGRAEQHVATAELESLIAYQIGALAAVAALLGARLRHVKPHGALFNMAARNREMADAIARATRAVDPGLILFGPPGSALTDAGRHAGLKTAAEAFADRAYRPDGALVPRSEPGALIQDADAVVAQALSIATNGRVTSSDGTVIPVVAETICLHGDTPGAATLAGRIRRALADAGVDVRAVGK